MIENNKISKSSQQRVVFQYFPMEQEFNSFK